MARIAEGDEHAFNQFFRQQWPQVYGTGLHLTRSPEQAKDLAQDIFAKLWENRHKLHDVQQPEAYLYIFSRNLIMDFLRKKVFAMENIELLIDLFEDPGSDALQRLEYAELERTMRSAIDSLPQKVKEVFELSRFEGLTHEQIARKLQISTVSSKTYIVRALRYIREYLDRHSDPGTILLIIVLLGSSRGL